MSYKNLWSAYINTDKEGKKYLKLRNISGKDITIQAGEDLYLNATPKERLEQYPTIPHFQKSVKIEDEPTQPVKDEVDVDTIPF